MILKRQTYFFVAFAVGKWTQGTCRRMLAKMYERVNTKIKMIVKESLITMVDSKMSYKEIDSIANEMLNQIEVVYAIA